MTKDNEKNTEKKYSDLKKKYKLPEFSEMDRELEISSIEETNFLLRAIARKASEKLDFYASLIEEALQPDTSNLYSMHEARFFTQNDKNKMNELYSRMMKLARESIETSLDNTEENEAKFISLFFSEWKQIKQELLAYVRKMKSSWNEDTDQEEETAGYMG
ncbi:MAG TPA: hypothetical protein VJI97_04540 [Candidatus Nanoarchaeia archaeon]|nr:hypothetical protein [Candidatus Nanoarchaeia archaeon]